MEHKEVKLSDLETGKTVPCFSEQNLRPKKLQDAICLYL